MEFKYQLIVIGSKNKFIDIILNNFWERIIELEVLKDKFKILDENNFYNEYTANCPAFCLYFGDSVGNYKNLDIVDKLLMDATMVLPIADNLEKFGEQIPKALRYINGFELAMKEDIEKIISLIIESFGLLRTSRKLFISYKRNESKSVAIQLYEEFEKSGFDVFLDTHSIRPGESFQDELWHRMTDCDVIVVLNTPTFLESNWCKEEIAEANCKLIGISQIVWPNQKLERMAEVCVQYALREDDFKNGIYNDKITSQLEDITVKKIISDVESLRARNLASRQDSLITEFISVTNKLSLNAAIQPERYISQYLSNGKERIFIPTVGIPHSFNCNESEDFINSLKKQNIESIHLIYDHIRIRDKWLKHLDWLNNYLKVKTLKIKNVEEWLVKVN